MGLRIYRNEEPRSRSRCLLAVEHTYGDIGEPVTARQFHGEGLFEAHPMQDLAESILVLLSVGPDFAPVRLLVRKHDLLDTVRLHRCW